MNCVVCSIRQGDSACSNRTNMLFCNEHFSQHFETCVACINHKEFSEVKKQVDIRVKIIKEAKISLFGVTFKMISQIEQSSANAIEKLDKIIQSYKNLLDNWKNPENKEKLENFFSTVLIRTQGKIPVSPDVNFFSQDFVIERPRILKNLNVRQTLALLSENFGLEIEGHTKVINSLVFSDDSQVLFSASTDKTIKVWERSKNQLKLTLKGHSDGVTCLALSSKTQKLFSGSSDQTIKVWCTTSYEELRTLREHNSIIMCLALNPEETLLASGSADCRVILWDIKNYRVISILIGHNNWVLSAKFNLTGSVLASGSKENIIKIWDMSRIQCFKTLTHHKDEIISVLFTSINFISASKDGEIAVSSIEDFSVLKTFTSFQREISSLALNQTFLTVCSVEGFFKIFDLEDLKLSSVHSFIKEKGKIRSVSSSVDGKFLAFGLRSGMIICIDNRSLDMTDNQSVSNNAKPMNQHSAEIKEVLIFGDYQKVATFSSDGVLNIWRLHDKELLSSCKKLNELRQLIREDRELEHFLRLFSI